MPPKKSSEKLGKILLKTEDEAGPYSLKQEYIFHLRKEYLVRKLIWYILAVILFDVLLSALLDSYATALTHKEISIIMTIIVVITCIAIFILASWMKNKSSPEMEDFVRTRFDKSHGEGAYQKAVKNSKSKRQ